MKYSEFGQFTEEQKKLAKGIRRKIQKLRGLGVEVIAKQNDLCAFLSSDMYYSTPQHESGAMDYSHPVPYLDCGKIDDAGADDTEYIREGVITEEEE